MNVDAHCECNFLRIYESLNKEMYVSVINECRVPEMEMQPDIGWSYMKTR